MHMSNKEGGTTPVLTKIHTDAHHQGCRSCTNLDTCSSYSVKDSTGGVGAGLEAYGAVLNVHCTLCPESEN